MAAEEALVGKEVVMGVAKATRTAQFESILVALMAQPDTTAAAEMEVAAVAVVA